MLNWNETPAFFDVIAMRRSGHHPIIRWIAGHFQRTTFNNDFGEEGSNQHREIKTGEFGLPGIYEYKDDGTGECDITNYEDFFVEDALKVAKSGRVILIIRDPFNCFASRLKACFNFRHEKHINAANDRAIDLWLDHARSINRPKIYPILYNNWFVDEEYRRKISVELCGRPYSTRHLDTVSPFGRWSSFDGASYEGKASQMDVFNRWRNYTDNEEFRRALSHPEIITKAQEIFGMSLC